MSKKYGAGGDVYLIDDREQYQNKNNIPSVFVSENEDVYKDEEKYMFGDDEYEINENDIIDFGEDTK